MSDLVIEIAELKLAGFNNKAITNALDIPIEWIESDMVYQTIKTLKGLDQGPFRFCKKKYSKKRRLKL